MISDAMMIKAKKKVKHKPRAIVVIGGAANEINGRLRRTMSGCSDYGAIANELRDSFNAIVAIPSEAWTTQSCSCCGNRKVDVHKMSDAGKPATEAVFVITPTESPRDGSMPLCMLAPAGTRVVPAMKLKYCGHCDRLIHSDLDGARNILLRKYYAVKGVAPLRFQLDGPGPRPMDEERRNY